MNRNEFFQALPITRLNLRMTGAALEICTDDIDDIHVMISGSKADAEAMRVLAKADTLTLEQPLFLKAAKAANSWLQVTIRLPRSWKGAAFQPAEVFPADYTEQKPQAAKQEYVGASFGQGRSYRTCKDDSCRSCPQGYYGNHWRNQFPGEFQQSSYTQGKIQNMGHQKAKEISLHPIGGQDQVQKQYIHSGCENIIAHAGCLLPQAFDHCIGDGIAVQHRRKEDKAAQVNPGIRVVVKAHTQVVCQQVQNAAEKAAV